MKDIRFTPIISYHYDDISGNIHFIGAVRTSDGVLTIISHELANIRDKVARDKLIKLGWKPGTHLPIEGVYVHDEVIFDLSSIVANSMSSNDL